MKKSYTVQVALVALRAILGTTQYLGRFSEGSSSRTSSRLLWVVGVLLLGVAGIQAQPEYTMGSGSATNGATINTCLGTFYDSGGAGGNYGTNQNTTVTFCSDTGQPLTMSFESYNIGIGDFLYLYDGTSTAAPQFSGSPYSSGGFNFGPGVKTSSGTCITVRFTSNASNSVNDVGWRAHIFCATTTTLTGCSGNFFDTGGPVGPTADFSSSITTICSDNGGQARVSFSSFALDVGYDFLYVYNGANRSAAQVAGSPFSATSPGTITGSGTCLTFHFVSDGSITAAGWASTISCVGGCSPATVTATPTCNGATYDVSGTITISNPPTSGTLTVSDGAVSQVINPPFTSPISYTLTGLAAGSGAHTVTADFSAAVVCNGTMGYMAPTSCGASADYSTGPGSNGSTVTTCSGKFADSGDLLGDYGNNEDFSITFCSGTTEQMTLTFNNFHTEAGADLLYVYDGTNTSSPQLSGSPFSGTGSGSSPGVVSSTGSCITFRFVSNGSTAHFGWDADISCSGGVTGTLPASPGWNGYPGQACTPNTRIEGTVFEDFNNNGAKESSEPFVKEVEVRLFDETAQVGTTTTNVNGLYSFTGLVADKVYRVEFTVPTGFEEGAMGTGSGSAVQFVKAGTCNANLGLLDVAHYCGVSNPLWFIPCYNNGSPSHASNSGATGIARFLYNASGQSPASSYVNYVTIGTIGTVWGTAYSRKDTKLFMGSFLKRHSGLGPGGIGAVYQRSDAGSSTSSTVFYDFGSLAGTVASEAVRFPGSGNAFGQVGACGLCDNIDPTTFAQVGKVGLGDIELSGDEQTLYVTNLADRKVYAINTNNPAPGSAVALPGQPWITGSPCSNGTARPWALKYRRGKLYVGVICDGGNSSCSKTAACNDLTATVYVYDGSTWTTAISFPLNYYRKAYRTGSNYWVRWMDNWSDFTANYANVTDAQFAQPIFANIEFDDDGSIILGFADRTAMQTGYQAPPPPGPASSTAERTFAHGDVLRANFNPNTGTYTLENNGVAGTRTTTNPSGTSGPGGKSFYWGDYWYGAYNNAGVGALAILPGSGEVMFPVADPIDPYAAGVVWMSNTNGKSNRRLEVYQGSPSGNAPNFAKNGGLGDMELACGSPNIEIGNYVWWDNNLNGRMDPDEPGIPNVTLRLYLDPNGNTTGNNPVSGDEILVATTTTDAYGRYVFSFSGASNGLNAQTWQAGHSKVLPNTKYVVRILNYAADAGLTAFATGAGSAAFVMSPTQNQGVGGGQRDNNAYDNPGNANAAVTTGNAGENDHEFDFAFGPSGACDLSAAPTANTPCVGETLTLEANAMGGTAPLTYSWSGPNGFASTAASPSIPSVTTAAIGMYSLTVTDNDNCQVIFTIAVFVNEMTLSGVATDATCGMSNGSINLTATGMPPYNYDWSNNALDGIEDPTGLAPGSYPVTVTDDNGCMATLALDVNTGGGPSINGFGIDPTCGLPNGQIILGATGTGPFTFDWDDNTLDGMDEPENLAAGTYTVTVTDAGGCQASASYVLANTDGPVISSVTFENTTCGLNNGSIALTVTGGLLPYTFDWDNNALDGMQNPAGLASGAYVVTVTDGNACTATTTVNIGVSSGLTISTTSVNETCAQSNGSIDLTVNGGTAPYTYSWSHLPGAPDPEDPTGLAAGNFNVTVTDAIGCTATLPADVVITDSPALVATTAITNAATCLTDNGAIDLTVTGGTAPYSFAWSNGATAEDINTLMAGTYIVTITDDLGCELVVNALVGLNTSASIDVVATDPTMCGQTGSLNMTITGGTAPYSIDWSNNGLGQTNDPEDLTGLSEGVYTVTVTEANGCSVMASASIRDIREPALDYTVTQPSCGMSNGAIDLEVVGGDGTGPYTYDWAHVAGVSNPQDQPGLMAGNYTITVTDELQCSTVLVVSLSSNVALTAELATNNPSCEMNNGELDLTVAGGTMPYTYDWSNLLGTNDPEDQMNVAAGAYAVTITDALGCTTVANANLVAAVAPSATCISTPDVDNSGNGTITMDVREVGPFTFDWDDDTLDGQQNPTGLTAGVYNVTVTDALGCEATCQSEVLATMTPPTFEILDPCDCFDIEYDAPEVDPLEFLDSIKVTALPGQTWRVIAQTGMEVRDSFVNTPLPLNTMLVEVMPGMYSLKFAHTSQVGYSVTLENNLGQQLSIGNVCDNPAITVPALALQPLCNINTGPIQLVGLSNLRGVNIPGTFTFEIIDAPYSTTGTPVTEIDPSSYPDGTTLLVRGRFVPTDLGNFCPHTFVYQVLISTAACPCADVQDGNDLGGTVFLDQNNDGDMTNGTTEMGQAGVTVEVYDCSGTLVCTTTTDRNGQWSCRDLNVGEDYRVEFSLPTDGSLDYLQPSFSGVDNGTNVQFVQPGTCEVDFGVLNPADYCQDNPNLMIPCHVNGRLSATAPNDALIKFPYLNPTAGSKATIATTAQIGTTWGTAYRRTTNELFAAAFLKRHSAMGLDGPGAIYKIGPDGVLLPNLFFDLNTIESVGAVPDNAARGVAAAAPGVPNTDAAAFPLVGKVGLGDVDISEDEQFLFTINLDSKKLYRFPTENPTAGNTSVWAIPDPGCEGGTWRPFALKVYKGEIYVGGICDAASSQDRSDLKAVVYRFDPAGTGTFTEVLSFDLDFSRGNASSVVCLSPTQIDIATHWNPWTDVHTVFADCGVNDVYPQPVLSDIEFDTDGSMILAFFDRWGHQTGEATNYPNGVFGEQGTVAGDVMRAFFNAGSFSLENNGVVGPLTVGGTVAENNYNVSSLRAPNGQGRGGREFYFGDTWVNTHDERSMGSLALLPGSGQVVMTAMDAAYIIYSGGVIYLNNTTGLQDRAFTVYSGGTASFGKAYALGDIELQCDPAPIQIGNYVWIDEDEDGVQDPCEEVIPDGLPISLYNKTTSAWVAVTTTTDGQYYFDDVTPNTAYAIVFGYDYTNMSSIWTPATMQLVLGGIPYELTPANTGEGTNPSLNDSDATLMNVAGLTGYPIIMYTVGRGTDHKLDLGLVNRCVPPSATFVPVPGDCTGVTINNNGRIVLTTVTGADKYGVSLPGAALYDGPDYATATVLPTLYADIVTNVPNTGLTYIVRIFNGDNGCFTDYTVEVPNTNCPIDPQGHIYCEETGEIIMGGSISVTGPGTFVITLDGSTGEYQFYTDGTPGVYNITYTPPVGYTASTTRLPAGTLDPTGQPDPYIIGSGSTDGVLLDDYTAAANVFHLAIDFALGDPEVFNNNIPLEGCSVTLGSTVFEDANNNGVQDASESGIAGVQVQLFSPGPDGMVGGGDDVEINVGPDGNLDTADDAPGGMLTNANGDYFFQGLDAGDYYVQIGAGEFGAGQPLELVNISSNTASGTFAGETDPDDNTDNDDEGTQPGGVGTVTTSGIVTLSANAEPTDATTETAQGNTQDNADDDNGNMTLDFGFYAPVSLGDYTWIDTDGNGAQNGGEPDLPGVVVTLYTSGGTPVTTDAEGNSLPGAIPGQMTTDGTGFYEFTNLPPGNYYVVFDIAGVTGADFYDFTTQGTATEATDSDANPATGQSDNTGALASGDNYPDLDAGVVCTVEVEAGMGATICSTATVDLTALGASIAPSVVGFAGTWTSSGTGIFNDANAGRFGVATTYSPSPADALAGQVILTLTSDDPAAFGAPACDPVSDDVLIVILKVDCGSFPWDGN